MDRTNSTTNNLILRFLLVSILVYALMGIFAGLPASANLGGFIAGLVVLFLGVLALMGIAWFALVKPLPAGLAPSKTLPLTHALRQGVALFLTLMGAVGVVGGLWDVTWHVRSGLPFGEDFFWEPHQFIYVALTAPIVVAAFLWLRILRHSSGSLRQRLKADPPVTLIFIGGVAMLFTLPADPLWHVVYGEDLTGLSVPHLVFSISSALTGIGTMSILLSYTPARSRWESILRLHRMELLIVLSLAFSFISLLFPTLGDWEALTLATGESLPRLPALVAARPDWAMPFLAAFVTVYVASMGLQIVRKVGTATLIWLVATVIRSVLFPVFGYGDTGIASMFLTLPFALAVDAAAWYRVSRGQPVSTMITAVFAMVAGAVAVLPQIPLFFTDPVLSADNLLPILIAMLVAGLAAAFMGSAVGGVVARTARYELPVDSPLIARPVVRTISALAVIIAAITILFVISSTMPSA